ncbi:MAG: hypothetical protein KC503_30210 [Myxococcales bacterium]|nr:hypothetical protein [Myxococcales bacterium]
MSFSPEDFLERFVLPLCEGGEVEIGAPVDADDLETLRAFTVTTTDAALRIELARQDIASRIWLYPVNTDVDEETLRIAVGVHNMLFLSHPDAEGLWVRKKRVAEVIAHTRSCLDLGPPPDAATMVARHTLLSGLLSLTRTDTELRFWVGRRFYSGQRPPARLLAWRGVRRVRENRSVVRVLSSNMLPAQQELSALLMATSPLTELYTPLRDFPPFTSSLAFIVLHHKLVSRAVAHRYLELGVERVAPVLARDFWRHVEHPLDVRRMDERTRRYLLCGLRDFANAPLRVPDDTDRAADAREAARDEIAQLEALRVQALPLRLMAQLVQYLYVTGCYLEGAQLGRDRGEGREGDERSDEEGGAAAALGEVSEDPRDDPRSVLVAAADCGLGPDERALGQDVASRFNAVVESGRRALGAAASDLTERLRGLLGIEAGASGAGRGDEADFFEELEPS